MTSPNDIKMGDAPPAPPATDEPAADEEPKYGGYSRFELELEVSQRKEEEEEENASILPFYNNLFYASRVHHC